MERDGGAVHERAEPQRHIFGVRRADQPHRHGREHLVRVVLQATQHAFSVGQAGRLAENLTIAHHHGVGTDDGRHAHVPFAQHFLHHSARLAFRQLFHGFGRVCHQVGLQRFVNLRHADGELNALALQQLLAARAAACQDNIHVLLLVSSLFCCFLLMVFRLRRLLFGHFFLLARNTAMGSMRTPCLFALIAKLPCMFAT